LLTRERQLNIPPEQAASITNEANVKHLAFYHLLPAPDNALTRRLFTQGISAARKGDWSITDDGNVYVMPIGSSEIRIQKADRLPTSPVNRSPDTTARRAVLTKLARKGERSLIALRLHVAT
jgi:hypothetical protein